jgi:hypothetical protein
LRGRRICLIRGRIFDRDELRLRRAHVRIE